MPQQIEVPEIGLVEFPDEFSDDQIVQAIKRDALERERSQIRDTSTAQEFFGPLARSQGPLPLTLGIPALFSPRPEEETQAQKDEAIRAGEAFNTPEGKQRLKEIQDKYRVANLIATPEARARLARDEQAEMASIGVQTVGLDEPVNLPKLTEEEGKTLFGEGRLGSAAASAQRAIVGAGEGFVSPEGAGMFLPGAVGKAFGQAFMAQMVKSIPEKVAEAAGAYSAGDVKTGDTALIDAAVTSGMIAVPHFLSRGERPPTLEDAFGKENANAIRDAVKQGQSFRREPTTAGIETETPSVFFPRVRQTQPYVPPEPGPMTPIPPIRPSQGRIRIPAPERTEPNAIPIRSPTSLPLENTSKTSQEVDQKIQDTEKSTLSQADENKNQNSALTPGRSGSDYLGLGSGLVEDAVLPPINNLKILDTVVSSLPVAMVNNLGGKERALNMLFHYPSVLGNRLAVDFPSDIAPLSNSLKSAIAFLRTKLPTSDLARGDLEMLTALTALDNSLVEVGRGSPGDSQQLGSLNLGQSEKLASLGTKSSSVDSVGPKVEGSATKLASPSHLDKVHVGDRNSKDLPVESKALEKVEFKQGEPVRSGKIEGELAIYDDGRVAIRNKSGEFPVTAESIERLEPSPAPVQPPEVLRAGGSGNEGEAKAQEAKAPKFKLTFEQFLEAPREGELLDALRTLPKSEPTPEQKAAKAKYDAASEAVDKAGLSWIYDRADPAKAKMVDAGLRRLPKSKKKIIDAYESALNEQTKAYSGERETRQKQLYDKAVEAGIIENPKAVVSEPEIKPPPPKNPATVEPADVLSREKVVKISPPEGSTQIRVTDTKGRVSVQPLTELKKGNPFQGVDIAKIEAGTIERGGKFKPMAGEVKVEAKSEKENATKKSTESEVSSNVEGNQPGMGGSTPETGEQGRIRQDLQSSGAVLWTDGGEIQRIFDNSNQLTRPRTKRLITGTEVPIRSAQAKADREVFNKTRVFLARNDQGNVLGRASDILAHRLLFASGKESPSLLSGERLPNQVRESADVLHALFVKLKGLRVMVREFGPKDEALARYETPKGLGDFISINARELRNSNLSDPANSALWNAVLVEELLHSATARVTTKSEIEAVWHSLSKQEQAQIRQAYDPENRRPNMNPYELGMEYTRVILQDRLSGKVSEHHGPITKAFKVVLERILNFLREAFGEKPENDIARQIIERIESAIKGEKPIERSVFEPGEDSIASGIRQGEEKERLRNRQVMGIRQGPLQEVESIFEQRKAIQDHFFNGSSEVTEANTKNAWDMAQELTGEGGGRNTGIISAIVRDVTGKESVGMAPALALVELRNYALKLANQGDRSLMKYLVESRISVMDPGSVLDPTQAGRTLRALAESQSPFWENVIRVTREREKAAGRALGVGEELFHKLMDTVENLKLSVEEVEGRMPEDLTGKVKRKPKEEAIEDEMESGRQEDANNAEKTARSILHQYELKQGAEWLKPDHKNIVREIVKEFLTPKKGEEKALAEESFTRDLTDRLVAVEVNPRTARDLAQTVWNEAYTRWANRRVRAINRAGESAGPLRGLIEEILSTPYQAQHDPAWRQSVAERWFMSKGLTREQSVPAAKMFNQQFESALQQAAERVARRVLEGKAEPESINDVVKAIRLGLTDPSKNWADTIAQREGWKPLSPEQQTLVAKLELERNNPALSPSETASINERMMAVFRHAGTRQGQVMQRLAESFTNSLLSGIRTMTIQLEPIIMTIRDYPIAALTDPKNALNFLSTIYKSHRDNFTKALKYGWQHDAYGFHLQEIDRSHNALKTWWEDLEKEYNQTKNPAKKAWVRARQIYASQQYVSRLLNSIDNAMMAGAQPWKLAYYSSIAFKEAGISTSRIGDLVDAVNLGRRAAYEEAIKGGADPDAASQRADWAIRQIVSDFVNNATGSETLGAKVIKSAENDGYSMVGRRAQGIKEMDEGLLSTPMNHVMEWLSHLRSKGGGPSIWSTAIFGFVNIPFRTARYWAQFSPYGLLRSGIHEYRTNRGLDTFWKQSYGTELQARARLREAIAGTVVLGLATAWGAANSTADDKAGEENLGLYITGAGPTNRVLKDAWAKAGWKQYSLNFIIGGHKVAIPLTRVGEAIMYPFMLAAAGDDAKWKMKEAQAAGRPAPGPVANYLNTLIGEYFSMSGQRGVFQGISQIHELTKGGNTVLKAIAKEIGTVASGLVMPFKQLAQSVADMFVGPLDYSSASSIVANQFPILGLPWQHEAVNRFGDTMYDRSWYGKMARTGIPIAIQVSKNPQNEAIYNDVLLQKGVAPPAILRSKLEERYGPLTNAEFAKFAQISGYLLKKTVLDNVEGLKKAPSEAVDKFLDRAATQANTQAEAQMQLLRVKPKKEPESAGGSPPTASIRGISGPPGGNLSQAGGGSVGGGASYRPVSTRLGGSTGSRRPSLGKISPSSPIRSSRSRLRRLVSGRLPSRSRGRIRISRPKNRIRLGRRIRLA